MTDCGKHSSGKDRPTVIFFLAFKRRFNSGALDRKYARWTSTLTVKAHRVNGEEGDIPENPCVD